MNNSVTLREGVADFRRTYKDHLSHSKAGVSNEARAFFTAHDVAHVLFGCDISLYGEGAVKIWTIFGTTLGFWKHISGYGAVNAFALAKNFSICYIARDLFRLLVAVPRIIISAKQMAKPWNWKEFEQYLDTPISQIRAEFNIKILT